MPADDLLTPPTTHLTLAGSVDAAMDEATGQQDAAVAGDAKGAGSVLVLGPDEDAAALVEHEVLAAARGTVGGVDDEPVVVAHRPGAQGVQRVCAVAAADTPAEARRLGARLGRVGLSLPAGTGMVVAHEALRDPVRCGALVEGLVLGGHRPAHVSPRPDGGVEVVAGAEPVARTVLVTPVAEGVVERAVIAAAASLLARNLANTPANVATPAWLADRAAAVAARGELGIAVREEGALRSEGFGGLTAVGGGSVHPPRLVELSYVPTGGSSASTPHVVLVGKGITFDTGGISVKPAEAMTAMRTDMTGSAVVLATIDGVAALGLPVRVTALLPLAENAFGEASYRPGDVVTPYGGRRTVEVLNTDAEGRMVLADALAYADDHLDPDVIVDVATLTGAARVALARSMGALFATDTDLADEIGTAGEAAGEPFWPLPLAAAYRPMLDSAVADLNNAPGEAGAITAALFLQEFVGERRWAHLDIAGPGRSDDDTGLLSPGGTGYGARALITWLGGLT